MRVAAAVVMAATLTACSQADTGPAPVQASYWCEHDESDTVVANSYCENEVRGYEWEPDGDDFVESHRAHKTTTKTSVPKTMVKTTTKAVPTTSKKPWYKPAQKTKSSTVRKTK